MDNSLTMVIMILIAIQDAYICDILNDIDRNWSIMIDEMEQIMAIYDNLDNFSEQADDRSEYFNERRRSIDNAIVNT
jgi:hypothetical protein